MSVKTSLDVPPCHSPLFILFSSCTDFQHIVVSPGFISEVISRDINLKGKIRSQAVHRLRALTLPPSLFLISSFLPSWISSSFLLPPSLSAFCLP